MSTQMRVAVVLSGCGVYDGSEIHEAVIALLSLSQADAAWTCAAPDKNQMHVIDHRAGQPAEESRNVLTEAARIARGEIVPLSDIKATDFDAVFFPGGFGAAKNLSTFATEGTDCTVDPETKRVLTEFHAAGKPIGAICIAPAVVVAALGKGTVTIGSDPGTAEAIEALGGTHSPQTVTEVCVDQDNKLVTAPAYMCEAPLRDIAKGIDGAVRAVLELAS